MDLKNRVEKCLGSLVVATTTCQGDLSVEVPLKSIVECLNRLKNDETLTFNFLVDIVGVDNLDFYNKQKPKKKDDAEGEAEGEKKEEETPPPPTPPRFELIYLLLCLERNERLQVKIRVPEDDMNVETATSIWRAANWPEREAFDMFGFQFTGHPNLKRLLMWDDFPGHPLRKDYPLEGRGEERRLVYD